VEHGHLRAERSGVAQGLYPARLAGVYARLCARDGLRILDTTADAMITSNSRAASHWGDPCIHKVGWGTDTVQDFGLTDGGLEAMKSFFSRHRCSRSHLCEANWDRAAPLRTAAALHRCHPARGNWASRLVAPGDAALGCRAAVVPRLLDWLNRPPSQDTTI
jgi:hypothetical protein